MRAKVKKLQFGDPAKCRFHKRRLAAAWISVSEEGSLKVDKKRSNYFCMECIEKEVWLDIV